MQKEELKLINMEDIETEKVRWLMKPFIAFRKVTIIEGNPGEGKTTMMLYLIAAMTKGEPLTAGRKENWTDESDEDTETCKSMTVLYQTAEDGLADTIKPRLVAAGADCSKVLVIDDTDRALTMMDSRLEAALEKTDASLVVLDPIQGYLGAQVDINRANEIRPVMKHLAGLAEKYGCAIVLIGHMNKCMGAGNAAYRGLGSIDFQAAARSVILVGRVKDDPEIRVVCQVKSSLAPESTPIAFRLSRERGFEWIGEYEITVDELLMGESKGKKLKEAKEFLMEVLANGQKAETEIADLADKQGIRSRTLRKAKSEINADATKVGNKWYWML